MHTSRASCARDTASGAGGRTIVAHLGSGASLCAMDAGRSVATTMGFSALDGLVMSSRCGSLDPGIILHLMRERHMSAEAVSDLLYEQSGLLGVSEISGDMQTLLQSADPRAGEAVDLFVYRIGRAIGSLAAAVGGLDTLVFTAGIGENAPRIRQLVGEAAGWLGVSIDPARNERGETSIGSAGSGVDVLVIPTDEEHAVAEGALACLEAVEAAPRRDSLQAASDSIHGTAKPPRDSEVAPDRSFAHYASMVRRNPKRRIRSFLNFEHDQRNDANSDDDRPVDDRNRGAVEKGIHERRIGEGELRDDHDGERDKHRRRAKRAANAERGHVQVSHVEQVEDLHHRQRVHDHGPRDILAQSALHGVFEDAEDAEHEQDGDKSNSPEQEARQQRRVARARRTLHHVRLGRLEGEDKSERQIQDHVEP